MAFTLSGSHLCRLARKPAEFAPTHDLDEAKQDAQQVSDLLGFPINVLNDTLDVVATVQPRPVGG